MFIAKRVLTKLGIIFLYLFFFLTTKDYAKTLPNKGLEQETHGDFTPASAIKNNGNTNSDDLEIGSGTDAADHLTGSNIILSGTLNQNDLDNIHENGNNDIVEKGGFKITQTNNITDKNVVNALPNDVNWRDTNSKFSDNDNDGVTDNLDLDDDNDGILDTVEGTEDTDGDGIPNFKDLDSDNDGIPDNIEAQTTNGYNSPNGIYDTNGVDTAYTGGLTPVDTDADTIADYIDTDADNDGILDSTEAGVSLTGNYGYNGLDNAYDNGDNYLDINGSFDNSQTHNFPDEDNDAFSGGDVDYRDDIFSIDNDNDGTFDELDLDDDNDGILDELEIGSCVSGGIIDWDSKYTKGSSDPATGDDPVATNPSLISQNVGITISRATNISSNSNYRVNDHTTGNSSYTLSQLATADAKSRNTFTFNAPVYHLAFTIYDLNQDLGTATDKVQIIITKQDGSNYTITIDDYNTGATNTLIGINTFEGTTMGTSNLVINPIPQWITQLQIVYENTGSGTLTGLQDIALSNITFCTPLDTDGDAVFNFRDLDADNDGIPDNIEAQTTLDYIAPTNKYNSTGIDLAYGIGLTPLNTDGDAQQDYLDLDADNDAIFDILESGLSILPNANGTTTNNVGENGLDNSLDNGDTYADVNGSFDNTPSDNFKDTDADVLIGGYLDYRDIVSGVDIDRDGIENDTDIDNDNDGITDAIEGTADTDGDGIIDKLDIDSDNDGIPDNIEAQSSVGYVAPSGKGFAMTDTNNNGLDDTYETSQGGVNLSIPINTDAALINSDSIPDYLDSDSDGDGIPDIQENGDADNSVSGRDSDNDGLDDHFEGLDVNDGYDVNDEIKDPAVNLPDEDSDLGTDDLDYRDADNDAISPGLPNNILWLRSDKDATPTLWLDQTTNGNNATDATVPPTKINSGLNFNSTFRFNGTTQSMQIVEGLFDDETSYQDLSAYIVSKADMANSNGWVFKEKFEDNSEYFLADLSRENSQIYYGIEGNESNTSFIWNPANTSKFILSNFYGSSAGTITTPPPPGLSTQAFYIDGGRVNTIDTFVNSLTGDSNQDFTIGLGGDVYFSGEIAEIMVFSAAQTDLQQQQIQSYLAVKYGITLNNTDLDLDIIEGDYILKDQTTKVWDYTANSAYHNDVAGIGRDDAMALEQKQSKSINSDAIITIALGAIANDNKGNSNTFSTNKNFLMWGNNNGSVLSPDAIASKRICALERTLARSWKIVENGAIPSVQIAIERDIIDNQAGSGALHTSNRVKMFKVADDAAFTTNVEYLYLTSETINSDEVYTVDYNFHGTQYFTYSEINGLFWNGDTNAWTGGNSTTISNGPSTNIADTDKVMIINAETSGTNAVLTESIKVGCVWIMENSKLVVNSTDYLAFDQDLILDGELRLIGDSQLIQKHPGISKVQGNGKLYKDQQAKVPSVYRYHYWSSPVNEVNLESYRVGQVMKDGNIPTSENSTITDINWFGVGPDELDGAPGEAGSTPITISTYWIYTNLNDIGDGSSYVKQKETGMIQRGQGYTMKSTGQNPQNFTFIGTPNDGNIEFNLTANTSSLLGNPYPSNLDLGDFISTNQNVIDGTVYFWEHTGEERIYDSETTGHNIWGYFGGYSQRNLVMGIAANTAIYGTAGLGTGTYNAPGKHASVAQGFFVLTNSTGGTLRFLNAHREYNADTFFFKEASRKAALEKDLTPIIKLGFEHNNDFEESLHRQIGISFIAFNDFNYQSGYDSYMLDLGNTDMYWEFDQAPGSKLIIAGIGAITDGMEVPLTIKINSASAIFIELDEKQNIQREFYLEDKLTGNFYDFADTIQLDLPIGVYKKRFYLVFKEILEVPTVVDKTDLTIYTDDNANKLLVQNPKGLKIERIKIYNTLGQKVLDFNNLERLYENKLDISKLTSAIYIVNLTTAKSNISKKIFKK